MKFATIAYQGYLEAPHLTRNRLGFYLYAQLLWDAEADIDALIADYCRYNFGPAAGVMERYFNGIGTALNSLDIHLSDYLQFFGKLASAFITPELTALAAGTFAEARQDRERILRNISLEQAYFQEYQKLKWNESSGANTVNLPLADTAEPFASPVEFPVSRVVYGDGKVNPDRTTVKMSWTPDALMIRVEAMEPDLNRVDFTSQPHDAADLWKLDRVEIFLNTPRDIPNSYKQIVVSAGQPPQARCVRHAVFQCQPQHLQICALEQSAERPPVSDDGEGASRKRVSLPFHQ
jgi:hypothetical protein